MLSKLTEMKIKNKIFHAFFYFEEKYNFKYKLNRILNLKNKKVKNFKFNNPKNCCLAPHTNINFDTMGNMRVCCYNNNLILGKYPETKILDAWNNKEREKLIEDITNLNFPNGCKGCKNKIIQNDSKNALFSFFDPYYVYLDDNFPVTFTFEFGTICNYECIMCGGKWSSSIRKNREKLPSLKTPYDDNFVEELKTFIPKLKFVNFLGGEPFLNPIYYKILDQMLLLNKKIIISITTNGSIYSSKIHNYLKQFPHLNIIISLDSLKEETYQFIRKNGNFKMVMENIEKFKNLQKLSAIAFCPMIQNIYELPDMVKYCIDNKLDLAINTVISPLGGGLKGIHKNGTSKRPWIGSNQIEEKIDLAKIKNNELLPEVSLYTLSKSELSPIIKHLNQFSFSDYPDYDKKYKDFINSLL
jgi:MoaA/NifB/PqqE/SkfB family radical SAM enzyme